MYFCPHLLLKNHTKSKIVGLLLDRVSDPMLSHVPKSGHFLDYLNFGALFDFFLWSICWNLCNLALVKCLSKLSLPNLYKWNIFKWSNYGTKGVDHWVTYPNGICEICHLSSLHYFFFLVLKEAVPLINHHHTQVPQLIHHFHSLQQLNWCSSVVKYHVLAFHCIHLQTTPPGSPQHLSSHITIVRPASARLRVCHQQSIVRKENSWHVGLISISHCAL